MSATARRRFPAAVPRLRQMMTGSTMLVLGTVGLTNIIRIVSSMTLTRLLTAEAFGIVGIVTSLSFAITMLSDLSFAPYVIRHRLGSDARFLDEVWTIRLVRSIGLAILVALLGAPVALYTHQPQVKGVVELYSVTFLFDGLASLSAATAVREGQLRRLSLADLSVALFQVALSILLAVLLRSYWALAITIVAGSGLKALLSYLVFPGSGRRFAVSRERMRDLWGFSRMLIVSSVLTMLISQTDKFVLSPILPLAIFGLYSVATTLASAPQGVIGPFVSRILLPIYAAAWRDSPDRLAGIYYRRKRLVMLLYMFAVGGLMGGADLLVAILYDPRFAGVAVFLRMLAFSSLLLFNNDAATEALIAAGETSTPLYGNIARLVWLGLAGGAAVVTGRPMAIIAVVATMEAPAMLYFWFALRRLRVFDAREEMVGLVAGGAGFALGLAIARAALAFWHF